MRTLVGRSSLSAAQATRTVSLDVGPCSDIILCGLEYTSDFLTCCTFVGLLTWVMAVVGAVADDCADGEAISGCSTCSAPWPGLLFNFGCWWLLFSSGLPWIFLLDRSSFREKEC